jgi:hypothetical protein
MSAGGPSRLDVVVRPKNYLLLRSGNSASEYSLAVGGRAGAPSRPKSRNSPSRNTFTLQSFTLRVISRVSTGRDRMPACEDCRRIT